MATPVAWNGIVEQYAGRLNRDYARKNDKEKLLDDFWNLIHNGQKVNINLLAENDVETYEVREDLIIVVHVPMAKREQKPIFINNDIFGGIFRRDHSGDYHCTRLQVKVMLRDQTDNTIDMEVLEDALIEDLNDEAIQEYQSAI